MRLGGLIFYGMPPMVVLVCMGLMGGWGWAIYGLGLLVLCGLVLGIISRLRRPSKSLGVYEQGHGPSEEVIDSVLKQ